ncbi:MAG: DUF885 domain-containing protein, partial [Acidobacteriota bacterium]|nr:DUF885 domain-containing protein [Acidobacteriota bacterium]
MPMSLRIFLIALLAVTVFLLDTNPVAAQGAAPRSEAAKSLHALFDEEWEYVMRENPTFASSLGDRRYNDRWEDASLAAIDRRHQHRIETLARLNKIDRAQLSPADQLNYDLFKKEYETDIEGYKYRWYLVPLNQRGGIQTADELTNNLRFTTVKDYEDWIARLKALPVLIEQTAALMREGAKTKMILPRVIMERIPAQIDKQIVTKPEDSPFYKPFTKFPDAIPAAERERLSAAAREAIAASVVPAFKKFRGFFADEYLPATFAAVGAWQMPNGQEMYAFRARDFTTTNMTPQEIHNIGLSEVKRIRSEMQAIMERVGFKGTLQDFFKHLRTDPQFYYKTPDELLVAYRAMTRRIDPQLVKVFKTLPRTPYGVEPIPDKIAPDTTTAYYN